jgi:asparagine synthase (glutamine-hydrolysing)
MGALVMVFGKRNASAFDKAISMLEALSHRGCESSGIASAHRVIIRRNIEELKKEKMSSRVLIGYNLAKHTGKEAAQPIQTEDFSLVFDGHLYPSPEEGEMRYMIEKIKDSGDSPDNLVRKLNGSYAFAVAKDGTMLLGKDPIGAYPLYFGETESTYAAASERKALWKIGIKKTDSFPAGNIAYVDDKGFNFKAVKPLKLPPRLDLDMKPAVKKLKSALRQSVEERVSDVEEVAVAFSGGVDSSLVSFLAKACGVKVHLICVRLAGQKKTGLIQSAAKALGLHLYDVVFSLDDLKNTLPRVLWLIEESNIVNVSIAIPFYWVAEHTARLGLKVLLAGQGADEIFGGYHRYFEEYKRSGVSDLRKMFYQDLILCQESGFPRDNKVTAFHKVDLRSPLADWKVIQLGLGLPVKLKIGSSKDSLRKDVLRRTARELGVPKFIAESPKQAIQYTVGVVRGMQKLAKKEGLTLQEYVKMVSLKSKEFRNGK